MNDTGFPSPSYDVMRQELAVHQNAVDGADLLSDAYLDNDDFCSAVGLTGEMWDDN